MPITKLTKENIETIILKSKAGKKNDDLAKEFGVSVQYVRKLVRENISPETKKSEEETKSIGRHCCNNCREGFEIFEGEGDKWICSIECLGAFKKKRFPRKEPDKKDTPCNTREWQINVIRNAIPFFDNGEDDCSDLFE